MPELSLRHYKTIVMVADFCSFTLAAHKLCVSVPAMSKIIKEAEDYIGFTIFDRSPKSVSLTSQGRAFLKSARDVVIYHTRSSENALLIKNQKTGSVRIAATQMINATFLISALSPFRREYPDIHIEIHDSDVESMQNELIRGNYDLVISPKRPAADGLSLVDICDFPLYFVSPSQGRPNSAPVTWPSIAGQRLFFQDSRAALEVMQSLQGRHSLDNWSVIRNTTTALAMVENGIGAMVSAAYVKKLANAYQVNFQKIVEPEVNMPLSFYFRESADADNLFQSVGRSLVPFIQQALLALDEKALPPGGAASH
jgi:DNA-binding transcriptional LysR family regulator